MINCFKDPIHVLMSVLLSTNEDEDAVDHVDGHRNDVREEPEEEDIVKEGGQIGGDTLTLRSSLRKVDSNSIEAEKKEKKKKVQWVDVMGIKDLAEIREFESSGEDDIDSDRDKNCDCVIL